VAAAFSRRFLCLQAISPTLPFLLLFVILHRASWPKIPPGLLQRQRGRRGKHAERVPGFPLRGES
jgi:hypothetical protein